MNCATDGFTHLLEYHPLINARAHNIHSDGSHFILNREFRNTYDEFLDTMVQKRIVKGIEFSASDNLMLVYYLQLQDRVDEAIKLFNKVPAPKDGDEL